MKDICEAAGLSRGGLYTHYGSTGQVFADIIEELMSGLESQVAGKMERGLPASLILKQYYSSKTMLCSLIEYGIGKGEFRQAHADAVADLLLFSYQGVRMLSSIMPLDDDNIPEGMIREIRSMLVK